MFLLLQRASETLSTTLLCCGWERWISLLFFVKSRVPDSWLRQNVEGHHIYFLPLARLHAHIASADKKAELVLAFARWCWSLWLVNYSQSLNNRIPYL